MERERGEGKESERGQEKGEENRIGQPEHQCLPQRLAAARLLHNPALLLLHIRPRADGCQRMATVGPGQATGIPSVDRWRRPGPRGHHLPDHASDHRGHIALVHPGTEHRRGDNGQSSSAYSCSPPRPSQRDWAKMDGPLLDSPPRQASIQGIIQSPEPKSQSSPRRQRRTTPSRASLAASSSSMRPERSNSYPVSTPARSSGSQQQNARARSKDVWCDDDVVSRSDRDSSRRSGSYLMPSMSRGTSSFTSDSDDDTSVSSQDEQGLPEIRVSDKETLAERLRTKSKRGGAHRRQRTVDDAIPEEADYRLERSRDNSPVARGAARRHQPRSPSRHSSDRREPKEHRHSSRKTHRKGSAIDEDIMRQSVSTRRYAFAHPLGVFLSQSCSPQR